MPAASHRQGWAVAKGERSRAVAPGRSLQPPRGPCSRVALELRCDVREDSSLEELQPGVAAGLGHPQLSTHTLRLCQRERWPRDQCEGHSTVELRKSAESTTRRRGIEQWSKLRSKAHVVRRRRRDHTMSGPGGAASDARQALLLRVRVLARACACVRARAAGQPARVL